jgi:nucleoside-diphosphate-sugar epimerase
MQTILGANGTIGTVLAKELVRFTEKVRLVSRHPKKINDTDELFPADLSDPVTVDKAVAGSDVVYLLVGFDYNINAWRDKWPKLMRAAIDACIKHNAKLVFFDNVYVYDVDAIGHMTEDSPINPPSKKGLVRKQIAEMVMTEVKAGKLTALIARSADFYGPHNERSFLNEVIYKNMKKGSRPKWFVDAYKKHSFTYTPDAAKATAVLGNTADAYNQVWHLPTAAPAVTGTQMAALFMQEMKVESKIQVLPVWMIRVVGLFIPFMKEMPEMMYQYDRDYIFDSTKFEKRFALHPTPYAQGVKEIVAAG